MGVNVTMVVRSLVRAVVMMVVIMSMLGMIMLMIVSMLVFVTPRFISFMMMRFHFFGNIFSIFNIILTLNRIESLLFLGDQVFISLLIYQL